MDPGHVDASSRYRIVSEIGRGGMGTVFRVHDSVRGEDVALKRGKQLSSFAWVRIKREFRVAHGIRHPNLVRLYELAQDDEGPYFTMELVDGVDLFSFVFDRARGRTDYKRLAHVLPQLIEALACLHDHGLAHCDLKPSNVLVSQDGSVKVADFGVLSEIGLKARSTHSAATVAYAAPEHLRGAGVTPSVDLYALGATLFELVAGRPPFVGSLDEVISQHLHTPPPSLVELVETAPQALSAVCRALLDKSPERRPSLSVVASALLPALGARPASIRRTERMRWPLVGREQLERTLRDELEAVRAGGFRTVVLEGPSGVGKTALLLEATFHASRNGLTFEGVGRGVEALPFNVLDGVIDQLATLLSEEDDPEVLALKTRAASAFPVLGGSGGNTITGSREVAFRAVCELLKRVAERAGLLLLSIDDLQHADADALSLLAFIIAEKPKHVAIFATLRSDLSSLALTFLREHAAAIQCVDVTPLGVDAIEQLFARSLSEASRERLSAEEITRLATDCGGQPLLAEMVARSLSEAPKGEPHTLDALFSRSLTDRRDPETLAAILANDGRVALHELVHVTGFSWALVQDDVDRLCDAGILRLERRTGGAGEVRLYHDAIRHIAESKIDQAELSRAHERFISVIDKQRERGAQRLLTHLLGAGRTQEAAELAVSQASLSRTRHAYSLAAQLHGLSAQYGPAEKRIEHEALRADALMRAARYREAAACWDALSEQASDPIDRAHFMACAAYACSTAGDAANALVRARTLRQSRAFKEVGLPKEPRVRDYASALLGPRPNPGTPSMRALPAPLSTAEEREIAKKKGDILSRLTGVDWFEKPDRVLFTLWAAQPHYARAGDHAAVAVVDYVAAYAAALASRRRIAPRIAARFLESARTRLPERATGEVDVGLRALDEAVLGLFSFRAGQFAESKQHWLNASESAVFAGWTGTYAAVLAASYVASVEMARERPKAHAEETERLKRACESSEPSAMHFLLDAHEIYRDVIRGDVRAAQAPRLVDTIPETQPQRVLPLLAKAWRAYGLMLLGAHSHARLEFARALARSTPRVFRTTYSGELAAIAAVIEATAIRARDPHAAFYRVDRYATVAEGTPPLFTAAAVRARAYAADAREEPDEALRLLVRAEREAEAFDQQISVAIARYQRGLRLGGDEGASLKEAARRRCEVLGASVILLDEDPFYR